MYKNHIYIITATYDINSLRELIKELKRIFHEFLAKLATKNFMFKKGDHHETRRKTKLISINIIVRCRSPTNTKFEYTKY